MKKREETIKTKHKKLNMHGDEMKLFQKEEIKYQKYLA